MNSKKIFTFFVLIFAFATSYSQNSLSGKITDSDTQKPLKNVLISIPDLHSSTQTDLSGNYIFKNIPVASYEIQVNISGYQSVSKTVLVNGKIVQDFALEKSSTEIAEVVVTGSSKATQIQKSPLPIVSINKQFLTTNLSTNIIDAVAKIPGVNAVTTGPNVSKPFIRGLGFNRILTLYDGIRQEGQQWGDEHGIEVDDYGIDKIEVIKGPASLMYGSDALAGVVNLIPTSAGNSGKISGSFVTEYQTNNGMFGNSLFLSGNKNGFEYGGRFSKKFAKDYQNKIDERVYNTGFNETSADLFAGLHKKWGFSHLHLSLYDNLQEIPDGSRDSLSRKFTQQISELDDYRPMVSSSELNSYKIGVLHQRVQHYRAFLKNSFFFGNSRLEANFALQKSWRREYSHPEEPYQETPGLFLKLNTFNYDVKYFLPEIDRWEIVVGANGMYQKNDVTAGTEFVIPSYNQFDIGEFVTIKKDFGKLNVSGGIRYDFRKFNNDELYIKPNPESGFDEAVFGTDRTDADQPFNKYTASYQGVTGSAGFSYAFSRKFSIKSNFSRGFRAPNISEISANGVHPGTGFYQLGNDAFKPEFSNQIDLGASYKTKKVDASASVFINKIDHYIYNSRLQSSKGGDSISISGGHEYPTYKFSQGKVLLYGFEAQADLHLIKNLHFENSASLIYGDNNSFSGNSRNSSNKYVPFMPPFKYVSEIQYDLAQNSKIFNKTFVKIQLQYTATQNRVYTYENTETATKGYTLINFGAETSLQNRKGNTIFDVYLLANNIFDVAYQDHLSRLKYFEDYSASPNGHLGIYNMGRNISLKLVKNF